MVWTCQYTWPAEIDWQLPKGTLCPKITSKLLDEVPSTGHFFLHLALLIIRPFIWLWNACEQRAATASVAKHQTVRKHSSDDSGISTKYYTKKASFARFCDAILKRYVWSCRTVERRSWQRQIPSSAAIWRVDASTFKFSVNYCCKMNPRGASGWSTFVRHLIGDKLLLLKLKI